MFVQTENTPNPNSLKFLPGKKVSNDIPIEITKKNESNNELIRNILSIKLLSFFNLFISSDIGEIFSTTRSESFCLNSEKFFPPNSFIVSDNV